MDQSKENGRGQIDEWAEDEIQQIRLEFGMEAKRSKEQFKFAMEQANILNAKVLQQLCVADLDAARRAELEEQIRKQKEQNAKNAAEIQRLQDEKVALQNALQKAELDFWAGKEQRQKILDQCIQALQASDHQTLQKVVDIVDKSKPKVKKTHRHPPPPPPKKNGPLNSIGNNKIVMDKNNNKKRSQFDRQLLVRLGTILDGDEEEEAAEKEETTNSKDESDQKTAISTVNETTKTLREEDNGNDDTLIPAGPSTSTSSTTIHH